MESLQGKVRFFPHRLHSWNRVPGTLFPRNVLWWAAKGLLRGTAADLLHGCSVPPTPAEPTRSLCICSLRKPYLGSCFQDANWTSCVQVVYHEYFNFFNINIMAFCFHLRCSFLHGSLRNKKAVALGLLTRSLYCSHHREQLCGVYSLLTRPIFAKQSWLFCNGDLFFFLFIYWCIYFGCAGSLLFWGLFSSCSVRASRCNGFY